MDFTRRKLPEQAAENLLKMPVGSVQPYALLSTPVYVFMRLNRKFVSVKAPLDFFTPDELAKFAPFGEFYFEKFVDQVQPFLEAGRRVRSILNWNPEGRKSTDLGPSAFELSDALLRVTATLWSADLKVEPFFATAFSEAVCGPLQGQLLVNAREADSELFERAVVASGWAVFLGCHLGYGNIEYLLALRERAFRAEMGGKFATSIPHIAQPLIDLVKATLLEANGRSFAAESFLLSEHPVSRRLRARMTRVRNEFSRETRARASIFGPGGFVDA